ncbi:MAG: ATP-binding protein [Gammaproteobacteria bacterium]
MKRGSQLILLTGLALFIFMLISLLMMSNALQDSSHFSRLYLGLLVLNTLGLLTLIVLIILNLRRLVRQIRVRAPGARMTVRMVSMFTILSVTPVLIVYYFSLDFLHRGIDNWFDLRVEQALDDSLELSRLSIDVRMRELLKQTAQIAEEFSEMSNAAIPFEIDELRVLSGAKELTLLTRQGRIVASSSDDPTHLVPDRPNETILLQLQQGGSYTGLDTIRDSGLHIRVVVNIPGTGIDSEAQIIQILFPMDERINKLASSVQTSFIKYKELSYLREQLKISFIMILTLVLLFAIFSTVWAAFYSARRLAKPVSDLAQGTKAVADGDYETQLPVPGNDELGFLVESFNDMTRRIAQARDEANESQHEAETQRSYLEAVLGRLSSGVLVLDQDRRLRTSNVSADQILDMTLTDLAGQTFEEIAANYQHLEHFRNIIETHFDMTIEDWREQVTIPWNNSHRILMCSGTSLPSTHEMQSGYVIVFDDITALIQGQRNAAWSEMARRLAHEIKNPLTPIQLATEKLRHKYLQTMEKGDADILDRLTNTIIQQVKAMQDMVNSFSEYARSPEINPETTKLNQLIGEVLDLYSHLDSDVKITTHLDMDLPLVSADTGRIRQVFNNLVKNAFDACKNTDASELEISTQYINKSGQEYVEIRIKDSGPGITKDIMEHIFEPYVTTKTKGTGLGLAIVKKIIEEHGGTVWFENNEPNAGATVIIRLPIAPIESDSDIITEQNRDAI